MVPNGPGCGPRTGATVVASQPLLRSRWLVSASSSGQFARLVRRLGPDLHFGLAEQRVARGQRDGPRLAGQRADPHGAEPAVAAERERVVAHQRGRARQRERDLAAAVPALVTVG